MSEFGSVFKKVREKKNIDLEEIAAELNIRKQYLKAIEAGEFEKLPAEVYTLGFIRNYARYLELDADALVMKYKLQQKKNHSPSPEEANNHKFYWLLLIFSMLLAVSAFAYRVYLWAPREETRLPEPEISMPVENQSWNRSTDIDTFVKQPVQKLELKVVAIEKTWIYVRFDGIREQELLLQPGDTVRWTAEDSIKLRLGNAGGIRLYHEGVRLPPLGRSGEVSDKLITLEDGKLNIKNLRNQRIPPPETSADTDEVLSDTGNILSDTGNLLSDTENKTADTETE